MVQYQLLSSNFDSHLYRDTELISLMERNTALYTDKTVYYLLEDGVNITEEITYGVLTRRAKSIAAILQSKGKVGDRVILLFPTGISFITALLGCFYAGMIGVPTYPPKRNKANERFKSILDSAEPRFILTDRGIAADLKKHFEDELVVQGKLMLEFEDIFSGNENQWVDPGIKPDDIAMLQYTSGSTGSPQGVMVSHFNMIHNCKFIHDSFGFSNNTIGVNWLPNFHDMGLIGCLMQVVYIGCVNVIIPPLAFLKNPTNWFNAITKFKGTTAGGPNFAFDYSNDKVADEDIPVLDLSSLTTLYCGAEPIRKETLNNFSDKFKEAKFEHRQFFPCYGLAESVLISTGGDHNAEPVYLDVDPSALEANKVVISDKAKDTRTLTACGFPWHGMSIAIVDPESCRHNEAGRIGEIWVKGPSVTKGYWNNIEETDRTYNAYISGTDDGPWMRTGDLGFIHEGQLYVSGRLKDLIIIRGSNFFPNDIELSMENCHDALMKNASAAFSADVDGQEQLVLLAEVKRAFVRELPEEEIFEAIRQAVFEEHGIQPFTIVLLRTGSIQKTSSGKIQRFAMKNAWLDETLNIVASWEMKKSEENIASEIGFRPEYLREWMIHWMAQTLELNPGKIDPDKPVSAYGLDSIKAVSLERDVNKQFGVEWPIESFLKENTINELVAEGVKLLRNKS